jgi:tRNA A37 threonylcarbamoyladenosine synthetase subunit TsaC/SUA5/YrdC
MSFFPKQPASRQGAVQAVPYGAASATSTTPFGSETFQIRLSANSACHYLVTEAGNPIAATVTNGTFLPANLVETVIVSPGQKISVIQAPTGGLITATAGTLNIVELS